MNEEHVCPVEGTRSIVGCGSPITEVHRRSPKFTEVHRTPGPVPGGDIRSTLDTAHDLSDPVRSRATTPSYPYTSPPDPPGAPSPPGHRFQPGAPAVSPPSVSAFYLPEVLLTSLLINTLTSPLQLPLSFVGSPPLPRKVKILGHGHQIVAVRGANNNTNLS